MSTMGSLPQLSSAQRDQFKKDAEAIDRKLGLETATQSRELAFNQQQDEQVAAVEQYMHPSEQQPEQAAPQESADETKGQYNWKLLREEKEAAERERARIERERDELLRRFREAELQQKIQQLQSQQLQSQQAPSLQDTDNEIEFSLPTLEPDALAEGKHVSQLHKENRQMRSQLKQYQKQTQQQLIELQLKAQYPDFDAVVSKDNVDELKRAHPSIAQALASALSNDPYNAAASTYAIIKQMGIDKTSQDAALARRMIQDNATKPRSAQAASPQRGPNPLAQANEYMYDSSGRATKTYQDQLVAEMEESRRKLR